MEQLHSHFLNPYLAQLKVDVGEMGFTKVWSYWKDIEYTPNYNKFYFICDGEGWLKIGEREYFPKAGQIYLMPEGVKQSYSAISENTFQKYWCHFNARLGETNLLDVIKLPDYIQVEDMSSLERLFKQLLEYGQSKEITSRLRLNLTMQEIICYYIENAPMKDVKISESVTTERIKLIVDYIDEHIKGAITVEELAKVVHLHPNYFIRFFKSHFGSSPMQYINNMRIEKAKRLILIGGLAFEAVAYSVGIKDYFYFSKVFKEHTGYSPTEFKKLISTN